MRKNRFIEQQKKISVFEEIYNDIPKKNLIVIFSNRNVKNILSKGFKLCPSCHIMVRVDEVFCRRCKRRLRFKSKRYAIKTNPPITESKYSIVTLFSSFLELNELGR